jgi:hypothetical protein
MSQTIESGKAVKAAEIENKKQGWKRIILDENDAIPPTGQFFGDNGVGYILRPGEEALVPPGIVEILENATTAAPVLDPSTLEVVSYRQKRMYPFTVLKD